ncbi:hypothetical protein Halha_1447 [Halobacteroides halobius DSM 5150]|uniref:Flagellar assembly protein T C-terminal domain-containing protein n=1 Tax=Halobacteroides halobius (strain ATCC 35273 / DSM 5150 / MD-1) TaxID=748449 RepID=L0K801_HALHC|nr:FlgT C-terminal domain-containing protein [Halobacteroides halobius]AGB41392.1 hypothetical protein Halha_1447 [Halobacteroides halobius DSM 5150]
MRKIFFLCLVFIVLMSQLTYGQQLFTDEIDQLTADLFSDYLKQSQGYIAKIEDESVYLNLGLQAGILKGDTFSVLREYDLLKDPITGVILGTLNHKIATLKVKEVKAKFSVAQVIEKSSLELQVGDRVKRQKQRIGILKFNATKLPIDIVNLLQESLIANLKRKGQFKVISKDKLEKLINKLKLENTLSQDELQLIGNKLKLDLLVTGEIFQEEKKLFIKGELYSTKLDSLVREEVMTISKENKLINYYLQQFKEATLDYRLLTTSKLFKYQFLDLVVANIDQQLDQEIILNTRQALHILNYQAQELLTEGRIDSYYRTKYDDYKLVVVDSNNDQISELIAQNFNYLFKFSWQKDKYIKQRIKGFKRSRPKAVVKLATKDYLITRNINHQLQFNLITRNNYKKNFKLQLNKNEGYRLAMGDLDQDKKKEIVLTSYQGKGKYKIKIYTKAGKLETVLPGRYGPAVLVTDLEKDGRLELVVHTTKKDNRVLVYNWAQDELVKSWESKPLDLKIRDLAVGDITEDKSLELLVLMANDKESKINIYQK